MILQNKAHFSFILLLSAILLSICAAYYSIIGIATLFAGAAVSVGIMTVVLEIGKLVTASYLFRFGRDTKWWLKIYLFLSIFALMVITSAGIFGYLSYAYQSSSIQNKVSDTQIAFIESNKVYIDTKIKSSEKRISNLSQIISVQESRLSDILTNPMIVKSANDLKDVQKQSNEIILKNSSDIEEERKKIEIYQEDIKKKNDELLKLRGDSNNQKDIVTFKFVADIFHRDIDQIVKYFIILLMSVFDPLAICLLLAYNTLIMRDEKKGETFSAPIVNSIVSESNLEKTGDVIIKERFSDKLRKIARKPFDFYIRK